jgi:hypothetical protein
MDTQLVGIELAKLLIKRDAPQDAPQPVKMAETPESAMSKTETRRELR